MTNKNLSMLILGGVIVLTLGAVGTYFILNKDDKTTDKDNKTQENKPTTTPNTTLAPTNMIATVTETPQITSSESGENGLNSGVPRTCSINGSATEMTIKGEVYTDGKGTGIQKLDINGFESGTLIKPDKTYTWSADYGFVTDTKGGEVQTKSGEVEYNGLKLKYDCSEWTVDTSKFELPKDINFMEQSL